MDENIRPESQRLISREDTFSPILISRVISRVACTLADCTLNAELSEEGALKVSVLQVVFFTRSFMPTAIDELTSTALPF